MKLDTAASRSPLEYGCVDWYSYSGALDRPQSVGAAISRAQSNEAHPNETLCNESWLVGTGGPTVAAIPFG
jgi:hypothetical protein